MLLIRGEYKCIIIYIYIYIYINQHIVCRVYASGISCVAHPSLISQFLCRYDINHPDLPDLDPSTDGFTPPAYDPEVWNVDGHGHGKRREIAPHVHSCLYEVALYVCINDNSMSSIKFWLTHSPFFSLLSYIFLLLKNRHPLCWNNRCDRRQQRRRRLRES